ncbi:BQ2448_2036 [Microbotryum intermedium]|uniref:BQ2448_2036 protein n=1 Tax=Microbotryum intermedium TaxID=269621 RepID=A0A238FD41_9BASI|nr:BQ2448_2036 [Microbotryum intermedium]
MARSGTKGLGYYAGKSLGPRRGSRVRHGRSEGIYTTWPEAQAQVKGFSGAVHKKLPDLHSAQEYTWPRAVLLLWSAPWGALRCRYRRTRDPMLVISTLSPISKISRGGHALLKR